MEEQIHHVLDTETTERDKKKRTCCVLWMRLLTQENFGNITSLKSDFLTFLEHHKEIGTTKTTQNRVEMIFSSFKCWVWCEQSETTVASGTLHPHLRCGSFALQQSTTGFVASSATKNTAPTSNFLKLNRLSKHILCLKGSQCLYMNKTSTTFCHLSWSLSNTELSDNPTCSVKKLRAGYYGVGSFLFFFPQAKQPRTLAKRNRGTQCK